MEKKKPEPGDKVKILAGPLSGMRGRVTAVYLADHAPERAEVELHGSVAIKKATIYIGALEVDPYLALD